MKIFNKPRCTEIKSKNNLRTQLGLLSDTRQQLFKHIQTFQQNNYNKDIKTTITYLTKKILYKMNNLHTSLVKMKTFKEQ